MNIKKDEGTVDQENNPFQYPSWIMQGFGLTATPDKRTIGYFDQNLVSEYSHEMAVADGVNVAYEVFIIDTRVSMQGGTPVERGSI